MRQGVSTDQSGGPKCQPRWGRAGQGERQVKLSVDPCRTDICRCVWPFRACPAATFHALQMWRMWHYHHSSVSTPAISPRSQAARRSRTPAYHPPLSRRRLTPQSPDLRRGRQGDRPRRGPLRRVRQLRRVRRRQDYRCVRQGVCADQERLLRRRQPDGSYGQGPRQERQPLWQDR